MSIDHAQYKSFSFSEYQRYCILLLAILMLSIGQFTSDIYLPSLPSLIYFFHTSSSTMQLSITFYYVGYGLSQFFYGPLSDCYGRRPIVLTSLSIYLLGTIICLFASSAEMLLLGRIIQGIGIGGAATIAAAIPHDLFTGKKVAQAFSYIGIAIAITPLIAPILGGYFQEIFGWQASFIFLLGYALSFLLIVVFYLPETNIHANKTPIKPLFVIKKYNSILCNKFFLLSLSALFLTLLGEILYIVWLPIILQIHFNVTPINNGLIMLFPASALALGGFISAYVCSRKNREIAIALGIIIIALSSITFFLFSHFTGLSKELIITTMSLYIIGSGISFPLYISICTGTQPENSGTAGALMSGMLSLGAGLWSAILLKTTFVNYTSLANIEGIICLLLLIVGTSLICLNLEKR